MKRAIVVYLLLCLVAPIAMEAKKKPFGNGLYWEFNAGVLTISGEGPMPDFNNLTYKKRYAKNLAPWYELSSSITTIIIEEGITSIGDMAFNTQNFPNNAQSVEIPKSLVSIKGFAFGQCKRLKAVHIKDLNSWMNIKFYEYAGNPLSYAQHLFLNGKEIHHLEIPDGVVKINKLAFSECKSFKSITIPTSVVSIDGWAFYKCSNLKEIYLPHSVQSIGTHAFGGVNSKLYIPVSVSDIQIDAFGSHNTGYEGPYNGEILSMPSFVIQDFVKFGISEESVYSYKNGIFNNKGELVFSAKKDRKITKCTDNLKNDDYYIIEENGKKGILKDNGEWLIPLNKTMEDCTDIKIMNGLYVLYKRTGFYGIISFDGKEIISTSRGYTSIGDYDSTKGTFAFTKKGYAGVCDAQGKEISLTRLPPTLDEIKSNGGYASAVELMNGSKKYYKVSKSGHYGLTDSEGKVIIPAEMEALEQAGTGFLRFKLNGFWGIVNYAGKIIIPTDRGYTKIGDYVSFTKRFAYEMDGWKGECNNLGVQVSKIKVNKPVAQQTQTTTEKVVPVKPEKKDTIIIKPAPVPMQVWKQCDICFGSGKCTICGGTGLFGNYGNRIICEYGCGGSGRCSFCAGQGGHYEVEYR